MSVFHLGAKQVYDTVLQTLGGKGVGDAKQTALQHGVQIALNHVFAYHPWTWRRRSFTARFTASSPWVEMPADYDSLAAAEIERTDPSDGVVRCLRPRSHRDFWRMRPTDVPGPPQWYRVVPSSHTQNTSSSWWYVMEVAPYPDGTYTWPGVEYHRSAPALSFTGSTGTVPDMPTEFHGLWVAGAEWRGARAMGRHSLARQLKQEFEESLADAVKRHDATIDSGEPQGVVDPYGDISNVP